MDKNLQKLSNIAKDKDPFKEETIKEEITFNDTLKENVNHPNHYTRDNALECIDEMILLFGKEETAIFCKLNAWKYRYRAADKNGAEDIAKSDWYIRKYKELTQKVVTQKSDPAPEVPNFIKEKCEPWHFYPPIITSAPGTSSILLNCQN